MIWKTNNATFRAYQSAVFCLQPWGDSATRKGYWDAMTVDCLPDGTLLPFNAPMVEEQSETAEEDTPALWGMLELMDLNN